MTLLSHQHTLEGYRPGVVEAKDIKCSCGYLVIKDAIRYTKTEIHNIYLEHLINELHKKVFRHVEGQNADTYKDSQ